MALLRPIRRPSDGLAHTLNLGDGKAAALVPSGLMAEPQSDGTQGVRVAGGEGGRVLYLKKPLHPSHVMTLK